MDSTEDDLSENHVFQCHEVLNDASPNHLFPWSAESMRASQCRRMWCYQAEPPRRIQVDSSLGAVAFNYMNNLFYEIFCFFLPT
mmetsp:Transcript_11656/g.16791  ORF Transcript_11656/g.16791 Transcript_11656/m.16791 type:complete len:84 (-) Transcript_11656:214-465(-)